MSPWCGPGKKKIVKKILWLVALTVPLLIFLFRVEVVTRYERQEHRLGPWGAGPGEFGLVSGRDGSQYAPLCFAVAPDGAVVIPDVANRRFVVVRLGATREVERTHVLMPAAKQVSCVEVLDGGSLCYAEPLTDKIWLSGGGNMQRSISLAGESKNCLHSVELLGVAGKDRLWVVELVACEHGLERRVWLAELMSGERKLLVKCGLNDPTVIAAASGGRSGWLVVQFAGAEGSGQRLCAFDATGTLQWETLLPGSEVPNGARLVGADLQGNCYMLVVTNDGTRVLKYDRSGRVLAQLSAATPASDIKPLVCRVSETGSVYLLEPRRDGLYMVVYQATTHRRLVPRR